MLERSIPNTTRCSKQPSRILDRKPDIAVECDGATSLLAAVESGRGVALVPEVFRSLAGSRVRLRLLDPDAASDDRGLCLHEFKRIHRHCAAFPRHSSLCLRQIERIAWTPISKDSSDLRRDHSTDRNRRSELLDLVWVSLTMEIAA